MLRISRWNVGTDKHSKVHRVYNLKYIQRTVTVKATAARLFPAILLTDSGRISYHHALFFK